MNRKIVSIFTAVGMLAATSTVGLAQSAQPQDKGQAQSEKGTPKGGKGMTTGSASKMAPKSDKQPGAANSGASQATTGAPVGGSFHGSVERKNNN